MIAVRVSLTKMAFAVAVMLPTALRAQAAAAPADSVKYGWKEQFTGMLNLSQTYYDKWAKGGTDALTWDINLAGNCTLDQEKFIWENSSKLRYGQTKISDLASRKSADEWRLESIYTRKLGTLVNPFAALAGWSQFTAGYKYDDKAGTRDLTSEFFDPAYFTQTVGVGITPIPDFKERLGFQLKETFSANQGYADDKKTTEIEDSKVEYGLSSTTEYQHTLMENILGSTKLDVFINFKGSDEIDADWANKITAKVNKLISVNFELEMLYDKDLSEDTQTRESLSVGIAFLSL